MRITTTYIRAMKRRGRKIAMLTAYDYPTARLLDQAGVPLLLVGDTLGMVVLGHQTTIPVTIDDMVYHTRAVVRGAENALVVADMPFMTYQVGETRALRAAARLIQKGGAHAVKLEGGASVVATVARLVACGIPVMGHIGLTPQSIHQLGGFRMQGKTPEAAARLVEDAVALEAAGAFAVVLETVPDDVAKEVTARLSIPTIGIGAGPHCDGQVQVFHDMIGLTVDRVPTHARAYANLSDIIVDAAKRYVVDVDQRPEVFERRLAAGKAEDVELTVEGAIEQPAGMRR